MMNRAVNPTVVWVVNGAVIRAVYSAVAGHGAVNPTVYWAVYQAVEGAVAIAHLEAQPHPGLAIYLAKMP